MIKNLRKDIKKRLGFKVQELLLLLLKFLKRSQNYYLSKTSQKISFQLRHSNIYVRSGLHCFCVISGRSKSVFSKFRMSRVVCKLFGSANAFSGLTKL
jgi:ribosomal protein S14